MARERDQRSEHEPATTVAPNAGAPVADDDVPPDRGSEREPGRDDTAKPERDAHYEPL